MKVTDFITEQEQKEYCATCGELCGRVCVIWRKASMRYDQAEREEQEKTRPCKHAVLKKGKWECSQFGKIDCEYQDEDFTCVDYVTKEKEINAIYCTKGDKRK